MNADNCHLMLYDCHKCLNKNQYYVMNLGNIDSFAMEACTCLRKTIYPFLNLFQRQEIECPKKFHV